MIIKRGTSSNREKTLIIKILLVMGMIAIIILLTKQQTTGLAIYNIGAFDNQASLNGWTQEPSTNNNGTYSIDTEEYTGGGGSLKGEVIGGNKDWGGEVLKQKLSTNLTQNGEYLNFYWKKTHQGIEPTTNNMKIELLRPDESKVTLWSDSGIQSSEWKGESIQINSFNQAGEYYLIISCQIKTGENTTKSSCFYDEITIGTSGGEGGGVVIPIFYSYKETPLSPITYNTSTTYDWRVSISDTDGNPWIELDGANKSMTHVSGNTYKFTTANLSAGIHSFYYWTWNSGGINNKARNSSEIRTYQVDKAKGEVRTIINGQRGNYNVANNTIICFSTVAPEWEGGERTIYVNGQLYGKQNKNFQNCTSFSQPQIVNITSTWDGGINYLPDSEEWELRVIKDSEIKAIGNTTIRVISPINKEYPSNTKELEFKITTDNELKECSYSLNGEESVMMGKSSILEFAKKVSVSQGENQVFFICKDNYGTIYNVQPTIKFQIKEEEKVGTIKTEINDTNNNPNCISEWKCTQWSECSATSYDPREIISGKIEVRGEERRICYDTKLCQNAIIEKQVCELRVPISAKARTWCDENYIEVYDLTNNKLVSRIKENVLSGNKRADIGFVEEGFEDYCDYCYNGIRDHDETGIDCGGKCQTCIKSEEKIISSNKLRMSLTIIQVLIIGGIIAYLLYWLIIKNLWKNEEREEINNPASVLVREARKKGFSTTQIKELFKKKGWDEEEISRLLREAEED